MTPFIILLYLSVLVFQCTLIHLNNRHLHEHGHTIPPGFERAIDHETLAKSSDYTLAKNRLSLLRTLFDSLLVLLFIFGGLLARYDSWVHQLELGFITSGVLFLLLLFVAQALLETPFSLFSHFGIEKRFAFNRMSFGLWCGDQLKTLTLSCLISGALAAAGLWLISAAPQSWWMWLWGLIVGFAVLMMVISPYVIEPLFFRFEPLKVEGLEEDIRAMMEKTGLSVSKVLQVDASKRSGHSNAYFTGLGRQKRVVLFDTLLEQLSPPEILAVLAHELGHMKKKHITKRLVLMALLALVYCWLVFVLVNWEGLPGLVGMDEASFFARVVILFFLAGILTFPLTPLFSWLSRRHEYEADHFAGELHGNTEDLAQALVQMSARNLSNLHPHPLYARFYYSHPPLAERVAHLRNSEKV